MAIAAALTLCGGSIAAAREGVDSAYVLLVLGAVLVGGWLAQTGRDDKDDDDA